MVNKSLLFSDIAAGLFKLYEENATPNKAFEYLGKFNLHWWKRRGVSGRWEISEIPMTEEYRIVEMMNQNSGTVWYSNGATVDSSGKISLDSPVASINISTTGGGADALVAQISPCLGHYCIVKTVEGKITHEYQCVFLPVDANLTHDDNGWAVYTDKYVEVKAVYTEDVGEWEYVQSSNRSAYPDSGEQDGYEYQYLGVPFEDFVERVKVEFGSYTGTGKYGLSNPNKLTFDGTPVYCVIFGTDKTKYYVDYGFLSFGSPAGAYLRNPSDVSTVQGTMLYSAFSKDSISWFATQSNEAQLNSSDIEYFYVALCL